MRHRREQLAYTPLAPVTGFPAIWDVRDGANIPASEVYSVLSHYQDKIDIDIYQFGGLLIRGFNQLRTAEDFEMVIAAVAPHLRDYVGGTSPRTVVRGKIMTATEVPSSWSIPLHQEMAYTQDLPSRIIFFCEQPAAVGGESLVGDMRLATAQINGEVKAKFETLGLRLRRTLPNAETAHLKPGVKKLWSEVFETTDKEQVEQIVKERGWEIEWQSNGSIVLLQDLLPAIRVHKITGESLWCNQAHFFAPASMLAWAEEDGRASDHDEIETARRNNPEMLDNIFLGNGEPVSDSEAMHIYRVLKSTARSVRLEKSDILILDNLRFAHGRRSFTGTRRILVALADLDLSQTKQRNRLASPITTVGK